ncbi:MAG: LptF/LptG family permease [Planctomycetaceae bacterium]|uniref:Putative permease YjgP/YjgQ family protein n=1 Tax=Lacipirellula limnantheis TaxID=2528024 RepID=A0A517U3Y3_9BACT|nr:LptF/LptG family permease [Lacipirellula limnantheis]MBL9161216.1 LptF/LptG family permease [Planctomycetaceae bacterium]QDT75331.1 putative permease YjgP/YjgQ family protein [Lacipirellula limnantheis]
MRILTRYILLEMLTVFLITTGSLTVFIFLGLIGKAAVDNGLGVGPLMRLLPYLLPEAMQFSVPGALLLATTVVYGRVSSSNEIVAVKSLGINPMVMLWPTLLLAFVVSFGAVALNDLAVSWGHDGVKRVLVDSFEEIFYGRLRTQRSFSTDDFDVNVKYVDGTRLIGPVFNFNAGQGEASVIRADAAEISIDPATSTANFKLENAEGTVKGMNVSYPGELVQSFPLARFLGDGVNQTRSPSEYPLRGISEAKTKQQLEINWIKHEMAAATSMALLLGRFDELAQPQWKARESSLTWSRRTLHRLNVEPYRRWANGFSCLGFALIGAPMAVRRRHGEFWGSFFACFLPILLVYYPMLVGCVDQAKDGVIPPQAVWLGNVVLAAWGVWLLRRVIRF